MSFLFFIKWLALIILLLVILFFVKKLSTGNSTQKYLKKLDSFYLSHKQSIQILQLGNEEYILLLITDKDCKLIKQGKLTELQEIPQEISSLDTNKKSDKINT